MTVAQLERAVADTAAAHRHSELKQAPGGKVLSSGGGREPEPRGGATDWRRPSPGSYGQAAGLPCASWLTGLRVETLVPAVAGWARTPAVLLAKVMTAWAAASDIWSRPTVDTLAEVSQAWW